MKQQPVRRIRRRSCGEVRMQGLVTPRVQWSWKVEVPRMQIAEAIVTRELSLSPDGGSP
jgi:hypothetical protein